MRQNMGNTMISPTLEAGKLGGSISKSTEELATDSDRKLSKHTVNQFVAYEAAEWCSSLMAPTELDLGVLLCSIAISLILHYLLGEGPL